MKKIIKRLEIIKSAIIIEDEEIIELQIAKLQTMKLADEVRRVLTYLEQKSYTKALVAIEAYLKRYSGVALYVDPELQGLKLKLKSIQSKLQILIEKKTEYLNAIEAFNRTYTLKVGGLIEEILTLKKAILQKKAMQQERKKETYHQAKEAYEQSQETVEKIKENIQKFEEMLEELDETSQEYQQIHEVYKNLKEELEEIEEELETQKENIDEMEEELEDETIHKAYEETKKSYEKFHKAYEEVKEEQKSINTLNDDEKKELKKLFRKAARLCHPDIVADKHKKRAKEIIQALNSAYAKQNLAEVKTILISLQNCTSFTLSIDTIEDVTLLKAKIEELTVKLNSVTHEIELFKRDETYITLSEVDDLDTYFSQLKEELKEEKQRLVEELSNIKAGNPTKPQEKKETINSRGTFT